MSVPQIGTPIVVNSGGVHFPGIVWANINTWVSGMGTNNPGAWEPTTDDEIVAIWRGLDNNEWCENFAPASTYGDVGGTYQLISFSVTAPVEITSL